MNKGQNQLRYSNNSASINEELSGVLLILAVLLLISIPALLAYRVWYWLDHGTWFSYTILGLFRDIGVEPSSWQINWIGVQKIVWWLLNLPIEWGLAAGGALMAWISSALK